MIKGLRLAFAVELRVFDRGCWIQVLLREVGIYTLEKNQINKTTQSNELKRT